MDNLTQQNHYQLSKKRKQKSPSLSSSSSMQSSGSSSQRCHSRNTTVIRSPRMLSFPYHNDSLFLPTVEQHRPSEKARSIAFIRSGSIISSSIPSSPISSLSSPLKRRRVGHGQPHYSHQTYAPSPLPSTNQQSTSWIQKAWKSFRKLPWRRQLPLSTR